MSNIAVITDTHFGIKNDAKYMLEYQQDFYKNIFFPYLIKNDIKTVYHLGDLFDRRKYINYVTLRQTKDMFLDMMKAYDIKMVIIPGNHDVYHKNTNTVNSLTELLGEYDNIRVIEKPEVIEDINGTKFLFIPWINSDNYESTVKTISNSTADILCGHLELAGFEMYAGVKNEHGMDASLFAKFKEVWSGHFHHKSENGNIKYLGAPMEFTFADCNDPRGFHIWDVTKKDLTFIQNSYKLYQKVYYNDETVESQKIYREADTSIYSGKVIKLFVVRKTMPALFEYFIEKLYDEDTINLSIHEDYSEFHEENNDLEEIKDQSTKELMEKYVDGIETDMDSDRIKNILNNLYVEALHVGDAGNI